MKRGLRPKGMMVFGNGVLWSFEPFGIQILNPYLRPPTYRGSATVSHSISWYSAVIRHLRLSQFVTSQTAPFMTRIFRLRWDFASQCFTDQMRSLSCKSRRKLSLRPMWRGHTLTYSAVCFSSGFMIDYLFCCSSIGRMGEIRTSMKSSTFRGTVFSLAKRRSLHSRTTSSNSQAGMAR